MTPGRVGYVLGGGGVHGSCEVGMLSALAEAGIEPDLVVGTSIGGINGAAYALSPGPDAVERLADLWRRMSGSAVLGGSLLGGPAR